MEIRVRKLSETKIKIYYIIKIMDTQKQCVIEKNVSFICKRNTWNKYSITDKSLKIFKLRLSKKYGIKVNTIQTLLPRYREISGYKINLIDTICCSDDRFLSAIRKEKINNILPQSDKTLLPLCD